MKLSKYVGKRTKEDPKAAELVSHKFLLRGGYIRQVASGIYTLTPIAKKIIQKIEKIIREEMNAIDGQEIHMPVVMPRELWEEAGRYNGIGKEMVRFKDRTGKDMLLGMTHEEPVVALARTEINSYKQLPCMMYQIQTKFRDEARSRGGLIRVREFTMKDAYSFHTNLEDMLSYYEKCHKSYEKIFSRAGLKKFISVESDTGMMGGGKAHEFMAVTPSGEDTLLICEHCDYKSNREVAVGKVAPHIEQIKTLEKVHTPNKESIEDVAAFLTLPKTQTAKAVFYKDEQSGKLIFALIRGDIEINEVKLQKVIGAKEIIFAANEDILAIGAVPGFASPMGVDFHKATIVVDKSILESNNLVAGANEKDYHFINFNFERDMSENLKAAVTIADISSTRGGDLCVKCGKSLTETRGIEIGNIFQLGTKYSKPMKCQFLDQNGKAQDMIMGCYGIGVGRLMASVIEEHHDDYGPIWPMSISPFEVQICALNLKDELVKSAAEKLYYDFKASGIDVLYDDRDEKAGPQFSEADLIGIPLRIVISPKNIVNGQIEFKIRGQKESTLIAQNEILDFVKNKIKDLNMKFIN